MKIPELQPVKGIRQFIQKRTRKESSSAFILAATAAEIAHQASAAKKPEVDMFYKRDSLENDFDNIKVSEEDDFKTVKESKRHRFINFFL